MDEFDVNDDIMQELTLDQHQEQCQLLKQEFDVVKAQLLKEKDQEYKEQLKAVSNGSHPRVQRECDRLQEAYDRELAVLDAWKQYATRAAEEVLEAERVLAEYTREENKRKQPDIVLEELNAELKDIEAAYLNFKYGQDIMARYNRQQQKRAKSAAIKGKNWSNLQLAAEKMAEPSELPAKRPAAPADVTGPGRTGKARQPVRNVYSSCDKAMMFPLPPIIYRLRQKHLEADLAKFRKQKGTRR